MTYQERKVLEMREKIEDTFIDVAEAGLQKGLSFEKAFQKHPEYVGSPYGEWERRYNEWQKIAVRPEYFTLAGERQRIKTERHQAAMKAADDAFYESNRNLLTSAAEEKLSFEKACRKYKWDDSLKPYYQRAFAEVWGKHAEMPVGDPEQDYFFAGFMND